MPTTDSGPIAEFLNYLTFQKRYSRHTALSYQNDLTAFFGFLESQYQVRDLREITPVMIRSWLAGLKEQKVTSKSINRKISTLKSFFKYHLKLGAIAVNPAAAVASLKNNKRLPSFIAEQEIQTLFRDVEFPDTWEGRTQHLLLSIFYQTGIRESELIGIRESQVDFSKGVLKVLGKGNKERVIPVRKELLGLVRGYIDEKNRLFEKQSHPLLLITAKGKKLYPKYVYNTVRKYLSEVSSSERKSPHVLRHSFATHLTNNGADINAVKELLGHASLASTQIYTHNSISRLKEIHKQAHPKS